jgi:hypothetical protein
MSFRPAPPPDDAQDDDTVRMPLLDFRALHERSFADEVGPSACERVAELVAQAVDGTLPLTLELHLDECAACGALLREATALSDQIKRAARGYAHAHDFEARVLAALDEARTLPR